MNSIVTPRRTDAAPAFAVLAPGRIGAVLAGLFLTTLLVSFRPFHPSGGPLEEGGGDIVNQLGYGTLGAVAIAALLCFADPRRIAAMASPWWALMLGFLALSVLRADDPGAAARAASFSIIAILAVVAVHSLTVTMDGFAASVKTACLVVLGLSYAGLVLYPEVALHGGGGSEPQHAGLWRGLFTHKNIAGPVMACIAFAGLYLYRRGDRLWGAVIFLAALVFVAQTGSRTTAGLVPAAILAVMLPGMIGLRRFVPVLYASVVVATAAATLGIVYSDWLGSIAANLFPDLTYTGRTTLWAFGGEMIAERPWTGYGYVSFWRSEFIASMDQPFDRDWDIRGIVHGHNGYMDVALMMGLPALVAAVFVLVIAPMADYLRVPARRENVRLADFLAMIVLFTTLNAFLETFFFHRADPVWMLLLFACFGLRVAARFHLYADRPAEWALARRG